MSFPFFLGGAVEEVVVEVPRFLVHCAPPGGGGAVESSSESGALILRIVIIRYKCMYIIHCGFPTQRLES